MSKNNRNMLISIEKGESQRREQSTEYELPDYISDIRRILYSDSRIVISNRYENEESIKCAGDVIYTVMLLSEDEKIRTVNISGAFNTEVMKEKEGDIYLDFNAEDTVIRAVNPRKLSCKCRVSVNHITEKYRQTQSQTVNFDESVHLEALGCECDSIVSSRALQSDIHISNETELDSTYPEISEIVYSSSSICIFGCRGTSDGANVRGQIKTVVLYSTQDGEYVFFERSDEINDNIRVDGATAETYFRCRGDVTEINVQSQSNSFGEEKIISADIYYTLELFGADNVFVEASADVFSPERETEVKKETIPSMRCIGELSESMTVSESASAEELGIFEGSAILFSDVRAKITSAENAENGRINIRGTICFNAVLGNGESVESRTLRFDYKYESKTESISGAVFAEAECGIPTYKIKYENGRIFAEAEIVFSGFILERNEYSVVTSVEVTETKREHPFPLTLYFPDGTPLWEIAKSYGVRAEDILTLNDSTEQNLMAKKVIMIQDNIR